MAPATDKDGMGRDRSARTHILGTQIGGTAQESRHSSIADFMPWQARPVLLLACFHDAITLGMDRDTEQ